MAERLKAPVC